MQTSAAGNKPFARPGTSPVTRPAQTAPSAASAHSRNARQRGLTLLELLVVLAIMALAMAGASLALRDRGQALLEQEAWRLAALLDAARAQSRASGVAVVWRSTDDGFRFDGLPPQALPSHWLDRATQAPPGTTLQLGPEPLIGRQQVVLRQREQPWAWQVSTDGLQPFAARALATTP